MTRGCTHAAGLAPVPPARDVCETCVEIGSTWVHLRQCLVCGLTLCCDDSPNRHMTGHWVATSHPVMRGASPGEGWVWCFADDAMVRETPSGTWEMYDPFLETGAQLARQHLEAGGSADPAVELETEQGFPIGEWFEHVRDAHASGELDPGDARLVEDIPGWRW